MMRLDTGNALLFGLALQPAGAKPGLGADSVSNSMLHALAPDFRRLGLALLIFQVHRVHESRSECLSSR